MANAKSYNEKTSELYADAERLRKQASNYMVKHNPAYQDPSYNAFATPLPGEEGGGPAMAPAAPPAPKAKPVRTTRTPSAEPTSNGNVTVDAGRKGGRLSRVASAASATQPPSAKADERNTGVKTAKATPQVDTKAVVKAGKSDFEGKTFQEAQQQIVTDMLHLKDEE